MFDRTSAATRRAVVLVTIGAAVIGACGGDDSTGTDKGVIEIAAFEMTPRTANCGNLLLKGAPESILVQVKMVNTTRDTVSLETAGTYGLVVRASAESDVGRIVMNSASVPFTPKPAII